jgi:hypothetical protein
MITPKKPIYEKRLKKNKALTIKPTKIGEEKWNFLAYSQKLFIVSLLGGSYEPDDKQTFTL